MSATYRKLPSANWFRRRFERAVEELVAGMNIPTRDEIEVRLRAIPNPRAPRTENDYGL